MRNFAAVWLAAVVGLAACAGMGTRKVEISPTQPAATADVRYVEDEGRTRIDMLVRHLAPPKRLSPEAEAYVVWIQGEGGPAQNLGTLVLDDNQNGRLTASTGLDRFDLFVTAERDENVAMPTGQKVIWTERQGREKRAKSTT